MYKYNFFSETEHNKDKPLKKDLVTENSYKLVTIGVESGVTIPTCIMNSEMIFFVVEGCGSILAATDILPLTRGDIVIVPAKTPRSIYATERLSLLALQIHNANKTEGA